MKKLLLIYLSVMAFIFAIPFITADREKVISEVEKEAGQKITVYNTDKGKVEEMELEDYIKGVLPAEMPADFHTEALKAQAVAARTYTYYKYRQYENNPDSAPAEHMGAVVCTNSAHCEAYLDKEALKEKHGKEWINNYYDKIIKAVDDTKNEIMMWENEPILAVFHSSSSAGRTESSKDVWGSELPYLVSVESAGETDYDGFYSTVSFSNDEFRQIISDNFSINLSEDKGSWFGGVSLTDGGAVKAITIGGVDIDGTKIRTAFGLRSTCFYITDGGNEVVFNVEGFGHGVGMSQYGAQSMAQNGSTYVDILNKYYSGAVLSEK